MNDNMLRCINHADSIWLSSTHRLADLASLLLIEFHLTMVEHALTIPMFLLTLTQIKDIANMSHMQHPAFYTASTHDDADLAEDPVAATRMPAPAGPASSRVTLPHHPPLLLPPGYRKKTYTRAFTKEVYLRRDIPCRSALCNRPSCLQAIHPTPTSTSPSNAAALHSDHAESSGILDAHPANGDYIIPSVTCLKRFFDVFARACVGSKESVSTMDQLRSRHTNNHAASVPSGSSQTSVSGNLSTFHLLLLRTHLQSGSSALNRRLSRLLSDASSTRRAALFENENHAETFACPRRVRVRKHKDSTAEVPDGAAPSDLDSSGEDEECWSLESSDERALRSIRRVAKWFVRHTEGRVRMVVIEDEEIPNEEVTMKEEERKKERMEEGEGKDDGEPADLLQPRETGGIVIYSLRSYLLSLQHRLASLPSSSSTTAASSSISELLSLHSSVVEIERRQVIEKVMARRAAIELQQMLGMVRTEFIRQTSRPLTNETETGKESQQDSALQQTQPLNHPTTLKTAPRASNNEFEEHLPTDIALSAVSRNILFRGHLHVSKHPTAASYEAHCDLGGRSLDIHTGLPLSDSAASSLPLSSRTTSIFIPGSIHRNRALDGDEIIVQILPRDLWKSPEEVRRMWMRRKRGAAVGGVDASTVDEDEDNEEDEEMDDVDDDDGEDDDAILPSSSDLSMRPIPTGRVVCILSRNTRPYVCTLHPDDCQHSGWTDVLAVPWNPSIPKIRIRTGQAPALANQRILVAIEGWTANSKYPSGSYLRSLGPIDDLDTNVACILHEHEISHPPFTKAQMKGLPTRNIEGIMHVTKYKVGSGYHFTDPSDPTPFAWSIPDEAPIGRRDLRQSHRMDVCSIDPIGCEDIDDALSCHFPTNTHSSNNNENLVEIGVHIADVTYFVPQGSLLDQEAARRGTSVYLADRRLDMLPAVLSSDLCSLRGGTDRLALSVLWTIDLHTGEVKNTWYGRTIIHNQFALSYEEAQLIYDTEGGRHEPPSVPQTHPDYGLTLEQRYGSAMRSQLTSDQRRHLYERISILLHIARTLRRNRLESGAVELDSFRTNLKLDAQRRVVGVEREADLEVHSTIAEWMIFANSTVAHAIWKRFPSCALLRHHPHPPLHRFQRLLALGETLGLEFDVTSNKSLAESLDRAEQELKRRDLATSNPEAARLIRDAAGGGGEEVDRGQGSSDASSNTRFWLMKLLRDLAARCLREAQYFSTGSVDSPTDFFHYGLAAPFYTHYTSPIRRYADIIVHRQLLQVIELEKAEFKREKQERKTMKAKSHEDAVPSSGSFSVSSLTSPSVLLSNSSLQLLASHMNERNRQAKFASRDGQELFLAQLFTATDSKGTKKVERMYEAIIVGLRAAGFLVLIPNLQIKAAVMIADRQGKSLLIHPDCLRSDDAVTNQEAASLPNPDAPNVRIELRERTQELSVTLSHALSPPESTARSSRRHSTLPLSHTFHPFDPVIVDVSFPQRANAGRYRAPKPQVRLIWSVQSPAAASVAKIAASGQDINLMEGRKMDRHTPDPSSLPRVHTSSQAFSSSLFHAALSPAGAKHVTPMKHGAAGQTKVVSRSPFHLIQDARMMQVPSMRMERSVEKQPEHKEQQEQTMMMETKKDTRMTGAPRVRHRISAARGGRVLLMPDGTIPPQLMIAAVKKKQRQQDEAEEDETY